MNKLIDFSTDFLPVMEHFYTIQGEGFHAGRPAYFIRLAGCDVGCSWCDVKESWNVEQKQLFPIVVCATKHRPLVQSYTLLFLF